MKEEGSDTGWILFNKRPLFMGWVLYSLEIRARPQGSMAILGNTPVRVAG
jgi:hypothetical protein